MVSLKAVGMLLRITDALVAIVAALFCYGFYLWDYPNIEPEIYVMVTIVAVFLQKNTFHFSKIYRPDNLTSASQQIFRVFMSWNIIFVVLLATAFLLKISSDFSRFWVLSWYLTGFTFFLLSRTALSLWVKSCINSGRLTRNTIIIGGGAPGERIIERLISRQGYLNVIGFFDDIDKTNFRMSLSHSRVWDDPLWRQMWMQKFRLLHLCLCAPTQAGRKRLIRN